MGAQVFTVDDADISIRRHTLYFFFPVQAQGFRADNDLRFLDVHTDEDRNDRFTTAHIMSQKSTAHGKQFICVFQLIRIRRDRDIWQAVFHYFGDQAVR